MVIAIEAYYQTRCVCFSISVTYIYLNVTHHNMTNTNTWLTPTSTLISTSTSTSKPTHTHIHTHQHTQKHRVTILSYRNYCMRVVHWTRNMMTRKCNVNWNNSKYRRFFIYDQTITTDKNGWYSWKEKMASLGLILDFFIMFSLGLFFLKEIMSLVVEFIVVDTLFP